MLDLRVVKALPLGNKGSAFLFLLMLPGFQLDFLLPEYFIIIDFFPPTDYKKRNHKNPKTNNHSIKIGVTEERISMSDENKRRPDCQIKKAMGLFCFAKGENQLYKNYTI